jgi:hypothetical protein
MGLEPTHQVTPMTDFPGLEKIEKEIEELGEAYNKLYSNDL